MTLLEPVPAELENQQPGDAVHVHEGAGNLFLFKLPHTSQESRFLYCCM